MANVRISHFINFFVSCVQNETFVMKKTGKQIIRPNTLDDPRLIRTESRGSFKMVFQLLQSREACEYAIDRDMDKNNL